MSNKALKRSLIGKEVYQRVMGSKWSSAPLVYNLRLTLIPASMKELVNNHKEAIEVHTPLDYSRLQKITYLFEFDREIQSVALCP